MKNMEKITIVLFTGMLFSPLAHAAELIIPNDFVAGTAAVADEVNANSTATENAVNDNNNRIGQLETALTGLTTRLDQLEQSIAGFNASAQTFYATDLVFLINDTNGTLRATAPGDPGAYLTVETNYEYYPFPGLDTVSFQVENDNTTVIFQASGQAYVPVWNAFSSMEVALRIDGSVPALGAMERLRMVTDDNISSGGQNWNIQYPMQLNAGTHTFSVLVKAGSRNQGEIGLDGRTGGRIKVNVLQLKGAN